MTHDPKKDGRFVGWPGYVVPAKLVAEELTARQKDAWCSTNHKDPSYGWVNVIATRAAAHSGINYEAIRRRLHDVLNGKQVIVNANLADNLLMAVDCHINEDTTIPNLPGCLSSAREMVDIYEEKHGIQMPLEQKKEWTHALMDYTADVLYGPASKIDEELYDKCRQMTASHFALQTA